MSKSNADIDAQDLALVDADLLPTQVRLLVNLIGMANTFKLLQTRGGSLYRVPLSPNEELLMLIGAEAAHRLCAAWGGQRRELPKCDKILIQLRDLAIKEERKCCSAATVGKKYNLTRRQVINISGCVDEPVNGDLFNS